jgi:hypothetical protein
VPEGHGRHSQEHGSVIESAVAEKPDEKERARESESQNVDRLPAHGAF